MTRAFIITMSVLVGLLVAAPSNANSYGYGGYGYGYGGYQGYHGGFYYYPTIPTYQTYGYGYYQQPYYSYGYTPTYQQSYGSGVNYKDGAYHWHEEGTWGGKYWPAGMYAWTGNTWVGQNSQLAVPSVPPDWKTALLKVAEKRDEYAAYSAALRALGVSPPPGGFSPPPGVGMGSGYTNYNTNLGTYGANGSTLYGYTFSSVKDLYGDTSMAGLFQQAQQLAANAQALGGEATQQFQATVAQEGANRSRVAEILARSQAAATALRAAQGSESHQSTTVTRVEPQQQQGPPTARLGNAQQPPADPAFVQLVQTKCLKCHGGDKTDGGFDVRRYGQMSLKDKVEGVWPRLTTQDGDKRMPKGGPALTPEELQLFFKN